MRAAGPLMLMLLVALGSGCHKGIKVQGGNLKERREKRRDLEEAQRKALEEASAMEPAVAEPDSEAAGRPDAEETPEPALEDAATGTTAAEALPGASTTSLPEGVFLVIQRRADGGEVRRLLADPRIGHYERTFRSGGGVRDQQILSTFFTFEKGLSRYRVRIRKVDRLELIQDVPSRSGVILRFHYRKPGREPEEFPAEELLGASHPNPPFLTGFSRDGAEHIPFFRPVDADDYLPVLEVDFTPEEK